MNRWLYFLTVAYYSDQLRPIIATLLVATGFLLAQCCLRPVVF